MFEKVSQSLKYNSKILLVNIIHIHIFYYIPSPLTVHFPITHSVRYQPILHTLYFMLHCAHVLNNVVLNTVFAMVEILDGRVGKHSVERVRYVINNLLISHCEIWSHFTPTLYLHSPRLMKILTLLVK